MFAAALVLAGCAALGVGGGTARTEQLTDLHTPLTSEAMLTLPAPPAYPRTETLIQTVVGRYQDRRTAFQAVLDLSPERVSIVLTAPSGPRIMTVEWTEAGVEVERTSLAPEELSALNILGDIFLAQWPADQIAGALPDGFAVDDGQPRTITGPGGLVVRVEQQEAADGLHRATFENLSFGYALTIVTETGG